MSQRALILTMAVLASGLAASSGPARAQSEVDEGKQVFAQCALCHTAEAGKNKIGPSLFGVVGRHSASLPDYNYSDAMKGANKTWDEATLDTYLKNPREVVPGTKMIFPGVKDDAKRHAVIAYLATLK